MKKIIGRSSKTPIDFKLLNDKDEDIKNLVYFKDKEILEKEIVESIEQSNDNIENDEDTNFNGIVKIDSSKIKTLLPFFNVDKEEFSDNNLMWYKPKSAPKYINANGIYCYFSTTDGTPSNLRFRLQYFADDWLFFEKVIFSVDDKVFDYFPTKTETDHGNGDIWEWYDDSISESDKELINALSNAKSAKMKLIGRQYYKIKPITKNQINSIKQTLELYQALGGNF
jgi:hypothetical protein